MFFDEKEIINLTDEIDQGPVPRYDDEDNKMPELSSIKLKNKLYNTRLQNNPADL